MVKCTKCDNEEMIEERMPDGHMHYAKAICKRCGASHWMPNPNNQKKKNIHNELFKQTHRDHEGKFICALCGIDETAYHRYNSRNFELDHIHPTDEGGPDIYENTQILCFLCHEFKTTHRRQKNLLIGKWSGKMIEDTFSETSKVQWMKYYNGLVDKEAVASQWMNLPSISKEKKEAEFLRYKCEVLEPLEGYLRFFRAIGINVVPGEKGVYP